MHLVGGFNDDRQLSQKLTNQLLSKFTFFPLSCPKKTKTNISSGWIWVEFVCSLNPQSFTGKKCGFTLKGLFLCLRTWFGAGLDCWGLPMPSAWATGSDPVTSPWPMAVESCVQFSWAFIPAHFL